MYQTCRKIKKNTKKLKDPKIQKRIKNLKNYEFSV